MKKTERKIFGPAVLLMYGVLVFYYYHSNLLAYLVNPIYNKIILVSGIIIFFLGLYSCTNEIGAHEENKMTTNRPKKIGMALLLLLPLVFGFFFKPQPLSSTLASSRGVNSNLASGSFDPTVFSKPTDQRSLVEWVRILNVDPEPDHYKDQKVSVEGKIILDKSLPEHTFYLGQFLIVCCAADVSAVGIPVQFDPTIVTPENDKWAHIDGIMTEQVINGTRQVVIRLQSITIIPTPKDAYETFQ